MPFENDKSQLVKINHTKTHPAYICRMQGVLFYITVWRDFVILRFKSKPYVLVAGDSIF